VATRRYEDQGTTHLKLSRTLRNTKPLETPHLPIRHLTAGFLSQSCCASAYKAHPLSANYDYVLPLLNCTQLLWIAITSSAHWGFAVPLSSWFNLNSIFGRYKLKIGSFKVLSFQRLVVFWFPLSLHVTTFLNMTICNYVIHSTATLWLTLTPKVNGIRYSPAAIKWTHRYSR